jgi:hypothetical protein
VQPTVSIVTPSLNQGRFIRRTIESVLSQRIDGLEYTVVDGGSTDETIDILRLYGERLRWISEPDRGQGDAVNKGILASTGEIIGWLNSDDIYYRGALRTVRGYMEQHPEVDIVYGESELLDEEGRVTGSYPTEPWAIERLKDRCIICQPAAFFRRNLIERIGLIDTRLYYCMDYEYWLRAALKGARFGYLPKRLAGSRMYPSNKTSRGKLEALRETNSMFRSLLGRVPDRWIASYARLAVEARGLRPAHGVGFGLAIVVARVASSLWWNRRISASMLHSTVTPDASNMRVTPAFGRGHSTVRDRDR